MEPPGTHLLKSVFADRLPTVSHGQGVFLYDTDGNRYLDGCSGAVNANLGHADPEMLAAMAQQSSRVTFAHRGAFTSEPGERLAARISELTGYPWVFLAGSGSEAIEAAIKFVLQYWREQGDEVRSWFSSHQIGYHGGTLGGLSLSGHPLRRGVASSLLHEFNTLTPPYAYRFAEGRSDDDFCQALLSAAAAELDARGPDHAGVVVEPVGGAAGGAITPPDGYLPGLSRLCRERGLPLVTDEVMTGVGRTGRMLAADHWDVRADVVVLGKGLGAGYVPISAVLLTDEIVDVLAAGTATITNGHTYSGNPLSCAVALTALAIVESRGLVEAAAERGEQLRKGLDEFAARHEVIGEVRGLGLLLGLELVSDRATREPGVPLGSLTRRTVAAARAEGLLVYPATGGVNDAVLVAPPLTTSPAEIDLLVELLDAALARVAV